MKSIKSLLFVALLGFISCGPNQKKEINDVGDEMKELTHTVKQDMSESWQELKASASMYRSKLDERIAEIDAKMDDASADAKEDLRDERAQLIEWKNELTMKMDKMGDNVDDGWQEAVQETEEFFDEIKRAINS